MKTTEPFVDESRSPALRGYWERPATEPSAVLLLFHGAGSNSASPLLLAVASAFVDAGIAVLRCDLPFRQARPHGPPFPAQAAQDRAGIGNAVAAVRANGWRGPLFLGGHSYGGRQASMLASADPELAARLLLLSYPLHPPRKPAELRTAHFAALRTPALFVHGTRDPFGSVEEMRAAIALISAPTALVEVERAGHDLKPFTWLARIPRLFLDLGG